MSIADLHFEVVKAHDGMLLSVGLFLFIQFVHLGLDYFAGAFVSLTEMSKGSLPALGFHTTE
jgi:hypothetical protein